MTTEPYKHPPHVLLLSTADMGWGQRILDRIRAPALILGAQSLECHRGNWIWLPLGPCPRTGKPKFRLRWCQGGELQWSEAELEEAGRRWGDRGPLELRNLVTDVQPVFNSEDFGVIAFDSEDFHLADGRRWDDPPRPSYAWRRPADRLPNYPSYGLLSEVVAFARANAPGLRPLKLPEPRLWPMLHETDVGVAISEARDSSRGPALTGQWEPVAGAEQYAQLAASYFDRVQANRRSIESLRDYGKTILLDQLRKPRRGSGSIDNQMRRAVRTIELCNAEGWPLGELVPVAPPPLSLAEVMAHVRAQCPDLRPLKLPEPTLMFPDLPESPKVAPPVFVGVDWAKPGDDQTSFGQINPTIFSGWVNAAWEAASCLADSVVNHPLGSFTDRLRIRRAHDQWVAAFHVKPSLASRARAVIRQFAWNVG